MTSSRVLTAVAVVSVILNLLMIGFFIGQRLPHLGGPHMDGPPLSGPGSERDFARGRERMRLVMGPNDLNLMAALRTLDPATRKAVQEKFRSDMPEIRARVEAMREKRRALLDVLATEPPDMNRLDQALGDVRNAAAAAQEHSHKLFMEIAADLPADQRAAFMKAAAENRPPHPPR